MTDPEIALKALLAEPLEEAIERERTTFDALAGPFGGRLVLFGAGRLGRKVLACLRARGLEPLAFVDNKAALWGEEVDGVRVQSPEEAAHAFGRTALFVVAIWLGEAHDRMSDRVRQLRDLGCGTVVPFTSLFWAAAGPWLPHYTVEIGRASCRERV